MADRPHVIILMADQLRPDFMVRRFMPNLAQMAEESVVFERGYCTTPLCAPARAAFFTGLYPNLNGGLINPWEPTDRQFGTVRAGIPNLYTMMEEDWDSWHTGKHHFFTEEKIEDSPESRTHWHTMEKEYRKFLQENGKRAPGGPRFRGLMPEMARGKVTRPRYYSVPETGCYEEGFEFFFDGHILRQSLDALRDRDTSKPLLLNAMFLAPHPPLEIPEPWYSLYKDVDLPENVGKWCPDQSPLQLYNLTGLLGARYTRDQWKEAWRVYAGLVNLLDGCIGQILDELKRQGIYDDSLILFTADHGEMLGSHCLWQKMCLYEESVRTPFFFKLPKGVQAQAGRIDQAVSAVDILPTVCELAGVEPPEKLSGLSLVPALRGEELPGRDLFVQFDGNGALGNFQRGIIRGSRKLIVDLFKDEIYLELYDVVADPQEMRNLAFESGNAGEVADLLSALRRHMRETGDALSVPEDVYEAFIGAYSPYRKS